MTPSQIQARKQATKETAVILTLNEWVSLKEDIDRLLMWHTMESKTRDLLTEMANNLEKIGTAKEQIERGKRIR